MLRRDILVLACKRSGHHALMDWMFDPMPGPKFKINHCDAKLIQPCTPEGRQSYQSTLQEVKKQDTHCLMYNVENADISQPHLLFKGGEAWGIQDIERTDKILVIRDPFNCIASAIKKRLPTHQLQNMARILKMHIEQALGTK